MSMAGTSGTTTASAFFPTGMLASIGRPTGFTPPSAAALDHGRPALVLQNLTDRGPLDRRERVGASIGIGKLSLRMTVRNAPLSSPLRNEMLPLIVIGTAAGG